MMKYLHPKYKHGEMVKVEGRLMVVMKDGFRRHHTEYNTNGVNFYYGRWYSTRKNETLVDQFGKIHIMADTKVGDARRIGKKLNRTTKL